MAGERVSWQVEAECGHAGVAEVQELAVELAVELEQGVVGQEVQLEQLDS